MLGGVAPAQVHRCQSADGKVTYSDQPCAGAAVAPAPPASPAPKSRQAMDKFHQIAEENQKPPALRRKEMRRWQHKCACAEWDKMERAYWKSLLETQTRCAECEVTSDRQNALPVTRALARQACLLPNRPASDYELRFLSACKNTAARFRQFWQVPTKGLCAAPKPIRLAYAAYAEESSSGQ